MKLRMMLVTVLVLCVSVPAYSQDFAILSGTISGIPAVSSQGYSYLGLKAVETNAANLGNEIRPISNGAYQMALFNGTYDLGVTGYLNDFINGQYTSFGAYYSNGYTLIEDLVITGDTNQNVTLPIYELSGVVTDTDGNPIPNVRLEYCQPPACGDTTTSLAPSYEGTYKLFFLPGTYDLKITPPAGSRFSTTQKAVTISGNQTLTIKLEPQNLLSGTISGIPAVSSQGYSYLGLKAVETNAANLGNEIRPISNGAYQMALFNGTYDLGVTGYLNDFINGQYTSFGAYYSNGYTLIEDLVIAGDTNQNVTLPIYELSGVVTDTDGNPIPNVRLEYCQPPACGDTTTSLAPSYEGTYKLFFLPGTYDLKITPPAGSRFSTTQKAVTISGNQTLTIKLEPQNLLSGTISGIPAVSSQGYSYLGLKAVETNAANLGNEIRPISNGAYQMALFNGTYDLGVTGYLNDFINGQYTSFGAYYSNGYTLIEDLVIAGDTNQNVTLPIYELSGVVTDTDGNPIPNVRLEYCQPPACGDTTTSLAPSYEGTYKLFFLPGTYSLKISAPPTEYPPFEIKKLHILDNTVRTIILSYSYEVLEEAIQAITPGLELHFDQFDVIDEGQAKTYDVPVAAPRIELEIIINWGGSEVLAQVFRPDGSLYDGFQSQTPPITFQIPNPELGVWKVKVTAVETPYDSYPIAVVAAITPNAIPIADAGGPYAGSVGEALIFDARNSSDTNGQIVRYEWDWNYDGTFDQSVTTDLVAHTWTAPYDGWVQLRVTDNEGAQGYTSAHVKITHSVNLASFAENFGRSDCTAGCAGNFDTDADVDGRDLFQFATGMP